MLTIPRPGVSRCSLDSCFISMTMAKHYWILSHLKLQLPHMYRNALPLMVVVTLYFLCISSATLPCSIWPKASTITSQVGVVVLFNHAVSISVLQRSSSPWWFLSIVLSWWVFKSRNIPSECQSETDSKTFLSSFRVGVAGAVREKGNCFSL